MNTQADTPQEDIEHIIQRPTQQTHQTPLLFLHGSWHGAWCWELFLDDFCSRGYEAHAISLPGHGKSSLYKGHINRYSYDDYMQCCQVEIEKIKPTPVVIGHSLGGAILQTYLEDHSLPGAALLASIPAAGFLRPFLRMAWAYPWQAFKAGRNGYAMVEKPEMAARFFLSRETQMDIGAFHARLVPESATVSMRVLKPVLLCPEKVKSPVLVVAGGKDFTISVDEQRRTAKALGAKFAVIPEGSHNLMMEPGWQNAANIIDSWIINDLKLT